jgi:hypothetical protein
MEMNKFNKKIIFGIKNRLEIIILIFKVSKKKKETRKIKCEKI